MGQFNIKRFWNTIRWYFSENRGRLFTYTISATLIAVVLESLFSWMSLVRTTIDMESTYQIMTLNGFGMSLFIAMIACLLSFSGIFSTLKSKQKRIAYLTLPATNLERYLVAFLMAVIITPICILVGLAIGDTLRMLIFAILGNGWFSCIKYSCESFFTSIDSLTKTKFLKELLEQSLNLWICSLYVLSGTWFRRRSFFIVTTFLILLLTLGVYLFTQTIGGKGTFVIDEDSFFLNKSSLIYLAVAVLTALSFFNFWLSYKIFKRFQIITSKWTNV